MNVVRNIAGHLRNGAEYAAFTATHAEPLEKVAKVVYRIIESFNVIFSGLSKPLLTLATELKDACTVFETVKIFGNIKMFVVPNQKNGKYIFNDPDTSWQKLADRVTLLAHNSFKFVKGLSKFGFVELGVMAKNAIGKLPIFTLVMDTLIVTSSFFSTWDSVAKGLPKGRQDNKEAEEHLNKWEYRRAGIYFLKAGDSIVRAKFEMAFKKKAEDVATKLDEQKNIASSLEQKKATLSVELDAVEGIKPRREAAIRRELGEIETKSIVAAATIKKLENSGAKVAARLEKLEKGQFKELADELSAQAERLYNVTRIVDGKEKTEKMSCVDFKLHKWTVKKENAKIEQNKTWLNIANAIGKIAVVALALVLTAVDVWIAPTLLSLFILGIVVDSIGWTKFMTAEYYKGKAIPRQTALA
jgi:hypothetical protein